MARLPAISIADLPSAILEKLEEFDQTLATMDPAQIFNETNERGDFLAVKNRLNGQLGGRTQEEVELLQKEAKTLAATQSEAIKSITEKK